MDHEVFITVLEDKMKEIDSSRITEAIFNLVKKLMNGEDIRKVRYRVSIEVPEDIIKVYEDVADQLQISVEDILGQLASEGIEFKLRSSLQEAGASQPAPQINPTDFLNTLASMSNQDSKATSAMPAGLDFSKVMDQMKQIQSLAGELQGLQKVVENATKTAESGEFNNSSESEENPK